MPPSTEYCNGIDDDCNGTDDDGPLPDKVPVDAQYWGYDGDGDLHLRIPGDGYDVIHACAQPTTAPAACTGGFVRELHAGDDGRCVLSGREVEARQRASGGRLQ